MKEKPIFFIGEGRSGTTIIFEAFSKHRDIAYLSNYTNRLWLPQVGFVHNLINKQGKKNQYGDVSLFNKFYPKPHESYETWEKLSGKKFRQTFMKDMKATDREAKVVKEYIQKIIKWQNKERFSTKLTGPPRITYLSSIYNNAYFVNVVRDPRAVVASLLNVEFWKRKERTPYWEGTFTEDRFEIWDSYDKSPTALAALELCSVYEQTLHESKSNQSKLYTLRYEDFIDDPKHEMEKVLQFVGLEYCNNLDSYIGSTEYKNMNNRYRERLSNEEIEIIENICRDYINEYRYL
ncbi:hypothetical protein DP73_04675 [Desulfosporosinus sp. HMP52]|uniref:sulfotransferase family protein n=1 Tax=Desulfosporosinus sp. HMP52 TaxID=1487923 RepID=UPI00051F8E69|nr:sulfotransferase [Desulfosporosinus sp. HMP52]KGK91261.1 hypothetical protein DP73_04675 [Desulfosporosinus sp. HMP52]